MGRCACFQCTESLQRAAAAIEAGKGKGPVHGGLFLIKSLLILREQVRVGTVLGDGSRHCPR